MAYIPVINNARLGADAVESDNILDGAIVNADVNASAAIAYSKLDLSGSIVTGDITNGTILNEDINASAAIDLSKLATDPLARANHTGTQLHTTISDFDSGVQTNRLDQMAAPTADVSMNSQNITNVADAVSDDEAVNLGQLTAVTDGLSYKEPVAAATTGSITLSGEQTIDGVLTSASRVLVKDQGDATDGIYVSAAGAWARADDADGGTELDDGATVWVKAGTANGDKRFTQTDTVTTIGTDTQTWVVTGSQAASTVIGDNTDVTDSSRVDGSFLRFEGTGSQWEATTGSNLLLDDAGQLQVPTDGASAGVAIGSDGQIYRSAANVLRTPDSFTVDGDLVATNSFTSTGDADMQGITTTDGRRLAVQVVAAAAGTESLTEADDDVVIVTGLGGAAHTVELPATPTAGQRYRIKDGSGGAATNNLTISTAGSETIDGAATAVLNEDYMAFDIVSDGTNYFIL